jgi:hypothetical protein
MNQNPKVKEQVKSKGIKKEETKHLKKSNWGQILGTFDIPKVEKGTHHYLTLRTLQSPSTSLGEC